ncbi:hypothetical protein V8F06_001171 [Rhypophila decipiens]
MTTQSPQQNSLGVEGRSPSRSPEKKDSYMMATSHPPPPSLPEGSRYHHHRGQLLSAPTSPSPVRNRGNVVQGQGSNSKNLAVPNLSEPSSVPTSISHLRTGSSPSARSSGGMLGRSSSQRTARDRRSGSSDAGMMQSRPRSAIGSFEMGLDGDNFEVKEEEVADADADESTGTVIALKVPPGLVAEGKKDREYLRQRHRRHYSQQRSSREQRGSRQE